MKSDSECRVQRWWKIREKHISILDIARAQGFYLRKNKSSQGGHYIEYPWEVKCNEFEFIELVGISRSMKNDEHPQE